jgi:hypothetical protein
MANSEKFQNWLRVETGRAVLNAQDLEDRIDAWMSEENLKIEVKKGGKWSTL